MKITLAFITPCDSLKSVTSINTAPGGAELEMEMATNIATKPQHTPGPWKVSPSGEGYLITQRHTFVVGHAICAVRPSRAATEDQCEANARLIAAAPNLLAQLENTLTTLSLMADAYSHGSATRNTLEAECDAIRAAINKATA